MRNLAAGSFKWTRKIIIFWKIIRNFYGWDLVKGDTGLSIRNYKK